MAFMFFFDTATSQLLPSEGLGTQICYINLKHEDLGRYPENVDISLHAHSKFRLLWHWLVIPFCLKSDCVWDQQSCIIAHVLLICNWSFVNFGYKFLFPVAFFFLIYLQWTDKPLLHIGDCNSLNWSVLWSCELEQHCGARSGGDFDMDKDELHDGIAFVWQTTNLSAGQEFSPEQTRPHWGCHRGEVFILLKARSFLQPTEDNSEAQRDRGVHLCCKVIDFL